MILTTFFQQVNASFRGTDDDPPTTGTDFANWLLVTNRKISEWSGDGKVNWRSLFAVQDLSPVVAFGTQTYNLPANFSVASDRVTVTDTSGNAHYYMICEPQERDRYINSVYISGSNPQKLTFSTTIAANELIIGGTLSVGGYYEPTDLTTGTDTIPVDDPYWLVYAVASELAFNDITYSDKSPDLNAKANNLYSGMISNNRRGSNNAPRVARTNVNRILSPSSETGVGTF